LIEPYAIGKKFNVAKRTDFDATIASGYAIMAVNRKPYMAPSGPKKACTNTIPNLPFMNSQ
jgi:hypothetical protein